ncbi:FAD-dependent oxidoreductase [Acidocella facilis]|uniref:FAD-dependent oxidoreductase n=1 Tax=Acidocella facilis TaxID=525 RepID=UPI001F41FC3F|nr:FAD-dependent oxidoreductase [Acidocella facilis]
MHLLIIGGSDAGISAALRAHELDPNVEITVVLADAFPNYSICGLPFFLSGETPDWRSLAHRTEFDGIRLLSNHTAEAVDASAKTVHVRGREDGAKALHYDRLIIATGAVPVRPDLPGISLPGVHLLHTMEDSFAVQQWLSERSPRSAVIVGGGYIGLEMADALTHRGLKVTVIERTATVLPTVDPDLGRVLEEELRQRGVEVMTDRSATGIERAGDVHGLSVTDQQGRKVTANLVLVALGVRPASELAAAAGAELGVRKAIRVTRRMQTNLPDVFAAGDCVETWHRLLERPAYLPLGTTAHKQGRIAGENAIGGDREFAGSLGSQAVKLFDLVAARTGLLEREALDAGFDAATTEIQTWDHKVYYPGARRLRLRITGDRRSGRLLGAQLVGHCQSEIAKRTDIFAAALFHGMTMEALNDLDLTYTPPLSSPWDPVQMAVQAWTSHASMTTQS